MKIVTKWIASLILTIGGLSLIGCASTHSGGKSLPSSQQFAAAEMNEDAIMHRGFMGPSGVW
jgi:hypothetical protein